VRYGGDEIVIVFPETSIDSALEMAERLRVEVNRNFSEYDPIITIIGLYAISSN
jgi:PleD family two-component response regulator